MGDTCKTMEPTKHDNNYYITLTMNKRTICRTRCLNPPFQAPVFLSILEIVREERIALPAKLPCCTLLCAAENSHQDKEWVTFLTYLHKQRKVAIAALEFGYFYIFPPCDVSNICQAFGLYWEKRRQNVDSYTGHGGIAGTLSEQRNRPIDAETQNKLHFDLQRRQNRSETPLDNKSSPDVVRDEKPPVCKYLNAFQDQHLERRKNRPESPLDNKSSTELVWDEIPPVCKYTNAFQDQDCHLRNNVKCENEKPPICKYPNAFQDQHVQRRKNRSESPLDNKSSTELVRDEIPPVCKYTNAFQDQDCHLRNNVKCENEVAVNSNGSMKKNYVQVDPSYLRTLGQTHSAWIFGAIAEFVDNSRDAKATRLDISIDSVYFKNIGKDIRMLSVIDDGHGMTHEEIVRMISFGHKQPDADDPDRIGKFGIGFKTGAMKLGKDALVLSQTETSRSIAFLSQSLNEGKDNLEIPIVSYRKIGQYMEIDTNVQDECLAKSNLKIIKDLSPFDKYLIGEKAGIFNGKGTGTQVYVWNLEKWGSNYSLEWVEGISGGSSFHHGDIFIRSRRIRSRPGQISQKVPLDYSLSSYLSVMFFDPRMKIHVQGAQVKALPLAKCLHKTVVEEGTIMGKSVQLILGRSQREWELANCGMFLYWHGRLIEAYKRVGSMIHNGDAGRGIIGVIDLTDLMDVDGQVLVHNNKQGFMDCEAYAEVEKWLGKKANSYLDKHVNKVELNKTNAISKPDSEWVQCEKCRKWRNIGKGFNISVLPEEWFCYMKPINGRCDMPEEKAEAGVVTISVKRSREDSSSGEDKFSGMSENGGDDTSRSNAKMKDFLSFKRCTKRRSSNLEKYLTF